MSYFREKDKVGQKEENRNYLRNENMNPLDYYGLRQPAIKQQLMPSYLSITKPTRDVSAENRSNSLSRQSVGRLDSTRVLLEKRVNELERELEEYDFERQANVVYNRQLRELGRLLGDETMEFEEMKGKIEDMILQGPISSKGTLSQSQVVMRESERSLNLLREEITQLKYQLLGEKNAKQILKQRIVEYEKQEKQWKMKMQGMAGELAKVRREMEMRGRQQLLGDNRINDREGIQQSARLIQSLQRECVTLRQQLAIKQNQLQQKDTQIKELTIQLAQHQKTAITTNTKINTNTLSTQVDRFGQIQSKYDYYLKEYESLNVRLADYEEKLKANEEALQKYQEMSNTYEEKYTQAMGELEHSRQNQSNIEEESLQMRNKIEQYQAKIAQLQTEMEVSKQKMFQKERQLQESLQAITLREGQIGQLRVTVNTKEQIIRKLEQDIGHKQSQLKQLHQKLSKLTQQLDTKADVVANYESKLVEVQESLLRSKQQRHSEVSTQLEVYKQKIVHYEKSLAEIQARNFFIQNQLTGKNIILETYQQKLTQTEEKLIHYQRKQLGERNRLLEEEEKKVLEQKRVKEEERRIKENQRRIKEIQSKLKEQEQKRRQYEQRGARMQQSIKQISHELQVKMAQIRRLQEEVSINRQLVGERQKCVQMKQEQVLQAKKEASEYRQKLRQQHGEIIKLGEYIDTLTRDIQQYQQVERECERLGVVIRESQLMMEQYKGELVVVRQRVEQMQRERDLLLGQKEQLRQQREQLKGQRDQLKGQRDQLKQQREQLRQQREENRRRISQFMQKQHQYNKLNTELEKLRQELEDRELLMLKQRQDSRRLVEEKQRQMQVKQKEIGDLNLQLQRVRQQIQDVNNNLESVQNELQTVTVRYRQLQLRYGQKCSQLEGYRQLLMGRDRKNNYQPQPEAIKQVNKQLDISKHNNQRKLNIESSESNKSMERIENVISNINQRGSLISQSQRRSSIVYPNTVVNNTIESKGVFGNDKLVENVESNGLLGDNQRDNLTGKQHARVVSSKHNSSRLQDAVERSEVEVKVVNQNGPFSFNNSNLINGSDRLVQNKIQIDNRPKEGTIEQSDNLSHLVATLNPFSYQPLTHEQDNSSSEISKLNIQKLPSSANSQSHERIRLLQRKIVQLQSQILELRVSGESKLGQIQLLRKKIVQLQSMVSQLNKRLQSYHNLSSREQPREFSGNFGGDGVHYQHVVKYQVNQNIHSQINQVENQHSTLQQQLSNDSQLVSQLAKKSLIYENQFEQAGKKHHKRQDQMSGSSFKYYDRKSSRNSSLKEVTHNLMQQTRQQVKSEDLIENKQEWDRNINKEKKSEQLISHNMIESQKSSRNSLSKLVIGEGIFEESKKRAVERLDGSKKSIIVVQSGKQIKGEEDKNRSIHEKMNDFSIDRESVYSTETLNNIQAVSYDLPQNSKRPSRQEGVGLRREEGSKVIVSIEQGRNNEVDTEQKQKQLITKKQEPISLKQQEQRTSENKVKPLSVIASNSHLESNRESGNNQSGNNSSSVKQQKQIENKQRGSSINSKKRVSPSPSRVSISYGRESKVIYVGERSGEHGGSRVSEIKHQNANVIYTEQQNNNKFRPTLPVFQSQRVVSPQSLKSIHPVVQNQQPTSQQRVTVIRSSQIVPTSIQSKSPFTRNQIPSPSSQTVVYHQNVTTTRASRIALMDNNATVRPVSKQIGGQGQRRMSKEQIQREAMVNDQYVPTNKYMFAQTKSPIKQYGTINIPTNPMEQTKKMSHISANNPNSPRFNSLKNSFHTNNFKESTIYNIDQRASKVQQSCCAMSPDTYDHKRQSLAGSQIGRFNTVKQATRASQIQQLNNRLTNNQSSFAQKMAPSLNGKTNSLAQSMMGGNSYKQDMSVSGSQDSGISVLQNEDDDGFNCCQG